MAAELVEIRTLAQALRLLDEWIEAYDRLYAQHELLSALNDLRAAASLNDLDQQLQRALDAQERTRAPIESECPF